MENPLRRFAFILAEKLGRTVEELLESISSSELTGWMVHLATHTSEEWVQTATVVQACIAPHVKRVPTIEQLVPRHGYRSELPMSDDHIGSVLAAYRT